MNSKSFKANPGALKEIRNFLSAFLIEKNIEKSLIEKIILAAGEAAMNIVQHSYNGKNDNEIIRTEIYLNNQELEIHFFDKGKPVVPKNIKPRNLEEIKPGGLGTFFIGEIMDAVEWKSESKEWTNHLILKKKIK